MKRFRNRYLLLSDAALLFALPFLAYSLRFEGFSWTAADSRTAMVFAMVVSLVHCAYGYYASGGPAGVGAAAGRALRTAILSIGVLDVLLTFALWGLVPEVPGMGV